MVEERQKGGDALGGQQTVAISNGWIISSPRQTAVHESAVGVRRGKAALSSGCKPHPATAPAGSNRSSHGGNEVAEAFD
jgi:hypothetical protein